jgi:hypothetical protein
MIKKISAAVAVFIFLPVFALALDATNAIEVKGQSYSVVKPDIAYFFLKINGSGENYEASTLQAKNKIEELKKILAEVMGSSIEINILKKEIKPKDAISEENIMEMQQEAMKNLAMAMKGEDVTPSAQEKKKEMTTAIMVYFSSKTFSDESILRLKSKLAEKEIAFDKKGLFDFPIDIDMNKSSILFGLMEPDRPLAALASEAYGNARRNAEIIARASNKKLGVIIRIGGCGNDLEGTVNITDKGNLLGRNLGPLSIDPSRLVVKYEKKYEFALQ